MYQKPLFLCVQCGADLLTHAHNQKCLWLKQESERQTIAKCHELGIPYKPDKIFGTPHPTGDP